MAGEAARLERAGALNLVASEQGLAWVEENPSFIDLTEQMSKQAEPEQVLRTHSTYIGSGMYSEVRGLGGAAIKVSSPTTGKKASRHGSSGKPEQLVNQFLFLSALGQRLETTGDGSITTPEQYLAFRTQRGSYVRVEEHMRDWVTLREFSSSHDWEFSERAGEAYEQVKTRLRTTLRDPILRMGLNDLGLEKREPLHAKNVLVPIDAADIESTKLCIIDQPGCYRGYLGKLSIMLNGIAPSPELAVQTA